MSKYFVFTKNCNEQDIINYINRIGKSFVVGYERKDDGTIGDVITFIYLINKNNGFPCQYDRYWFKCDKDHFVRLQQFLGQMKVIPIQGKKIILTKKHNE